MTIIDGFQGGPYTTQNMVQPVHDYPRRYTAKQLKTIYYSLIVHHAPSFLFILVAEKHRFTPKFPQMTSVLTSQEIGEKIVQNLLFYIHGCFPPTNL